METFKEKAVILRRRPLLDAAGIKKE